MGYKIHHSPVYQVTYGNGYFNNHAPEINRLLQDNSEGIQFDGEDIESAIRLEVPRIDLGVLIGKITRDKDKFGEWLRSHDINITPESFITIICEWIATSDPHNDYVVLTWF